MIYAINMAQRATMTLQATLQDGTSINLTISPGSRSTPAVTASATLGHSSLSIGIHTSPSNPIRSTTPSLRKYQSPAAMPHVVRIPSIDVLFTYTDETPQNPPVDIVAVDSGNKSYLFYVNPDKNLSYLESPDDSGSGDYKRKRIQIGEDDIRVSDKTQQVAAITWNQNDAGTKEVI